MNCHTPANTGLHFKPSSGSLTGDATHEMIPICTHHAPDYIPLCSERLIISMVTMGCVYGWAVVCGLADLQM